MKAKLKNLKYISDEITIFSGSNDVFHLNTKFGDTVALIVGCWTLCIA